MEPVDDKGDKDLALVRSELIRQIEYQSKANFIYSHAGYMAGICGMGFWRLNTQYLDDSTFDQEIILKHIPNPLSVFWDPDAIEPDKSDADYWFVSDLISKDKFKGLYPKARKVSVDDLDGASKDFSWAREDHIRVAEYWYKVPVKKTLIQKRDGTVKGHH